MKRQLLNTYTDEAIYYTTEPLLQEDGTTKEVQMEHKIKGKLTKSSTNTTFKSNDLTTTLTASYTFQTETHHYIPNSTKLVINDYTFVTGIPMRYFYNQEIPLRLSEVI